MVQRQITAGNFSFGCENMPMKVVRRYPRRVAGPELRVLGRWVASLPAWEDPR
jgi:hypothetical protein